MNDAPILPPSMIGMLGGGQLGRYALVAARLMGYRTAVLDPNPDAPAAAVADLHLVAAYHDPDALAELAAHCAVVTTEFENPPAQALVALADQTRVSPSPRAVAVAQDRIAEKRFFVDNGLPSGPFHVLETDADLTAIGVAIAQSADGTRFVVKTARLGYDGKGQRRIATTAELDHAWAELGRVPCVVEELLALDAEISVVLGRCADGTAVAYPPALNTHRDGILDVTVVPADVDPALANLAHQHAVSIADHLDYVGVMAVEFFVVGDDLFVNEMAPRPHNSGHWTLDGAQTSQFEQQIRTICNLAPGDPSITADGVAMANLLGDLWSEGPPDWASTITANSALHLYGKTEARPGRKMGHLTTWGDRSTVEQNVRSLRSAI